MYIKNKLYSYQGEKLTLKELEKRFNFPRNILYARLEKTGWSLEKSLATPYKKRPTRKNRLVYIKRSTYRKKDEKTYADYLKEAGYDPRKYLYLRQELEHEEI